MRLGHFFAASVLVVALVGCDDDDGGGGGNADTGSDARGEVGGGDTGGPDVPTIDQPNVDTPTSDTTPDVVTQDCGDITFFGECDGATLRYCDCDPSGPDGIQCTNGELVEADCTDGFDVGTGVCIIVSNDFGAVCALSPGDPCLGQDAEGNPIPGFCSGDDPACILGPDSDECAEDVGTCTGDEEEGVCNSDNLLIFCNETQPVSFNCAQFGGTCDADADACVDLPEDSVCGEGLECADGLTCEGGSDTEPGTCTADEGTGNGTGEGSGG